MKPEISTEIFGQDCEREIDFMNHNNRKHYCGFAYCNVGEQRSIQMKLEHRQLNTYIGRSRCKRRPHHYEHV